MNTDNLIAQSRARFDHNTAKKVLREKYEGKMIFAYNDGMWRAGPELQATLLSTPNTDAVILDLYNNPVRISSTELFRLSQDRWQEQMNAWLVEYEELSKNR